MTPAARLSAAIDILETYLAQTPAEKALTSWARHNRYAGAGDRAAIRDLVFTILRQLRSCAAAGGAMTGRGLVLGHLRQTGQDAEALFGTGKYAPAALRDPERAGAGSCRDWPEAVRLDYPDWLASELHRSLGTELEPVMRLLRHRAGIFVRVNPRKTDMNGAIAALAADEIGAKAHPLSPHALEITENPRRLSGSHAYIAGLIELQDAASQAVIGTLHLPQTGRILDYCAGGGGKALAMAAMSDATVFAHDIAAARMHDLPKRAARAGVEIGMLDSTELAGQAPFDLVFCDVPCSGSGAWRRVPAGKWALTPARLAELTTIQAQILRDAARLVRPRGGLAYATCSLFNCENTDRIAAFLAENPDFSLVSQRVFSPVDGGDGMFIANLNKNT